MLVTVNRVNTKDLLNNNTKTNLQQEEAKKRIRNAQIPQYDRYKSSYKYNANLKSSDITKTIDLSNAVTELLNTATEKLQLSARTYFKVIKVARTIADIEESKNIEIPHIVEALQYRLVTP